MLNFTNKLHTPTFDVSKSLPAYHYRHESCLLHSGEGSGIVCVQLWTIHVLLYMAYFDVYHEFLGYPVSAYY